MKWWAENQIAFPFLVPHAKKFLTIPVPSVASERLFSKVGEITAGKCNRIKTKNVDKFCFLIKPLNRMFCLNMIGQKVIIFVIDTKDTYIISNQYRIVLEIHGIAHH